MAPIRPTTRRCRTASRSSTSACAKIGFSGPKAFALGHAQRRDPMWIGAVPHVRVVDESARSRRVSTRMMSIICSNRGRWALEPPVTRAYLSRRRVARLRLRDLRRATRRAPRQMPRRAPGCARSPGPFWVSAVWTLGLVLAQGGLALAVGRAAMVRLAAVRLRHWSHDRSQLVGADPRTLP